MAKIMAPAGTFESLQAAIQAGADSVYFGVGKLNMRARAAKTFTPKNLPAIVKICREKQVETYLTVNTIIYDDDASEMKKLIDTAKKAGVSALICCDSAVMKYAKQKGIPVHLSTQANVSNIEAVAFYAHYADVVVLARELSLQQIRNICSEIKKRRIKGPSGKLVQIEVFVHGALCVSISGKCYMSLALYNSSANRGACLHTCRRKYRVFEEETGHELVIDNNYVMSPKDLCTIGMIDKLIDAGVEVLKIEGRGRSPEYVSTTVKCYKEAVLAVEEGTYTKQKIRKWETELSTVFNRGFWKNGYYLGKKLGEWAEGEGSNATMRKEHVGRVIHFWPKKMIAEFCLESGMVRTGDCYLVIGPTTGVVKGIVSRIIRNEKEVQEIGKGKTFTMKISEKVRVNDALYLLVEKR
ncbi:U32 family peptidase [Candidatus Woesearchaeota archaeon]|nr:MAG: hypothetical protein QS99_C0009G0019 [archaeon GW2011_AR4]MBS3129746.1 U32 family peptidase [Candidatus Woesearchaeota archaeon]HIH37438.1 U32 family peptidase [Candidatus Woesearchaeota archaeon]HIH48191.1 U32 family peptidase [Candidatus Woesearchaeota archaeon]HIJ02873.1 U32 family peptidase [Candidatus Woesearchaeota archaeon]